eukprot:220658-Pyramimonas_sp.AAC.1
MSRSSAHFMATTPSPCLAEGREYAPVLLDAVHQSFRRLPGPLEDLLVFPVARFPLRSHLRVNARRRSLDSP